MTLLSAENLKVAIDGESLLDGISLEIRRGETLGLVGESGSGKSMTALALMRLLPERARFSGRVLFEGRDLSDADERELCDLRGRHMAMIFQEPMTSLNPVQTVSGQIAEAIRVHRKGSRAEAAGEGRLLFERVGLGGLEPTRFPHELSGGQRQRVLIAMAVALGPSLLIADEPATALDATTQADILALLQSLVADGMGLLFISHDLAVVAKISDRIAVMREGKILETTESRSLAGLRHPYSRAMLAASAIRPRQTNASCPIPQAGEGSGATRASNILEATGLTKSYGRLRAVDGVSLSMKLGETLALVGESGCGKSTLGRMILALEKPDAGAVRIAGEDFTEARGAEARRVRRRVQAVFQDPYGSFNPRMRVAEIIAEPLHLAAPVSADVRRAEARRLLEAVGLEARDAIKYAHEFSGGERQRIAIARALIVKPSLIVLDEAVSALDVTIRAQILDLLAALRESLGLSYFFISHDLAVVRAIADRVAVMKAGRIVEEGAVEDIFLRPQQAYTRTLLDATPQLDVGDGQ